jgi:glycosyltransferase involved in cell wall biosynthesis
MKNLTSLKERNNKVAILHYAGPPTVGGVESTIYHHARLLADFGLKVTVIAGRGEDFNPDVEFHLIPGLNTRDEYVQLVSKELARGAVTSKFDRLRDHITSDLARILSDIDVCIVHNAMSLHLNLSLTAALKKINDEKITRLVAWNHDFAWHDKLYIPDLHEGYPWDLLRTPWSGVKYVVVSEHRKIRLAELLDIPETEIEVVTPGVDIFEFLECHNLTKELFDKLDLLKANPLMLLPARIIPRKNIKYALYITAALVKKMPNTMLVITGPPGPHNPKNLEYLNNLKKIRKDNNLEKNVHFLYEQGKDGEPFILPDKIVSDLFRIADLLLFPSSREGFGIPVLEAGLAKLPVFASDIPPIRESGDGYVNLFDSDGDPENVAGRIYEFALKDNVHKLRRRVIEQFSWSAIVKNKVIPIINNIQDV